MKFHEALYNQNTFLLKLPVGDIIKAVPLTRKHTATTIQLVSLLRDTQFCIFPAFLAVVTLRKGSISLVYIYAYNICIHRFIEHMT